ncbi:MAG: hypothetical protein K6G27_13175 [Lachnospiraceae bacterium]|nr:hypothetical protein [Lachnospiraceae bacterium]
METVVVVVVTIVSLISFAVGNIYNEEFKSKYGEPAIVGLPFGLQCTFLVLTVILCPEWQDDESLVWFIVCILCVIATYALGLYMCKKHAMEIGAYPQDIIKAMTVQFLYPIGIAFVAIVLMLILSSNKEKKKKK